MNHLGSITLVVMALAAGAGDRDLAYARVEVTTAGGRVWAYGSVVDNDSSDPTTIPLLIQ